MIRALNKCVEEIKTIRSDAESSSAALVLLRILLQHYCVSIAEWLINTERADHAPLLPPIDFESLRQPSDGTLASLAIDISVAAENRGWSGITRPIWLNISTDRPCARLLRSEKNHVEGLLQAIVRRRNDGSSGHGVAGGFDIPAEIDALEVLIERLGPVLPIQETQTGRLVLRGAQSTASFDLSLLRMVDGKLVCYRKIAPAAGGSCRISAQVRLNSSERKEYVYEANDILSLAPQQNSRNLEVTSTFNETWRPLANIPDRQTDLFKGRDQEIQEIQDWMDDLDSRACLVYGDGGIGKTTLVIECLHRLLEGRFNVSWRPELISYYTAKRTRWGVNGLEVINVAISGASDAFMSVKRCLEGGRLEREWYSATVPQLASKLSALLGQYGISRQQHLMVIDNAETLAQSADEVKALAKSILEISRHVGRVLVTSRRREEIEARFIETLPLNEEESEDLLRDRADQLKIRSILQAGSSTLRRYARKLGCKPLILEVLIQVLGDPATSLERGFNRVMQMQQQDLGEFLYSDAWHRMTDEVRHLLLIMANLGDVHDEVSLKLCANEARVSVLEAYRAIGESRGIASVTRIGSSAEVAFSQEFLRFCSGRKIRIDGLEEPSDASLQTLKRRYQHFLSSSTKQISDRMERAFRHPLARAAYRAARDGNDQDAEIFYELAILSDQGNGALFDRYAYFLASRSKLDLAYDHSVHATQIDPKDAEFWFTRGVVESRMNRAEEAIQSLQRAQRLGKEPHLCAFQSCYAYLKLSPPDYANARAAIQASQKVAASDPYRLKFLAEVESLKRRVDSAMRGDE